MILTRPMEDLRVYHPGPLVIDRERKYHPGQRTDKPDGLWFSVQADWWRFCTENCYEDGVAGKTVYRLDVRPVEDLLLLRTPGELLEFTSRFALNLRRGIDWPAVAERWPGIVIQPYVWEMRLDNRCSWYYTWDAASGCVWDLDYVRSVTPFMRIDRDGGLACL